MKKIKVDKSARITLNSEHVDYSGINPELLKQIADMTPAFEEAMKKKRTQGESKSRKK